MISSVFKNLKSNSRYLELDEFYEVFDKEWDQATYSFTKYEARQEYDEELYHVYLEEDKAEFINKLTQWRLSEKSFYDDLKKKRIKITRLRPVIFPLTEYLKFEYYCYLFNCRMGEDIYYIDVTNSDTNFIKGFDDFVIFDNKAIFIHNYDDKGVLRGAWYIIDGPEVEKVITYYNEFLKQSRSFNDMHQLTPEIQQLIDAKLAHEIND